jgi:hypothetical protein
VGGVVSEELPRMSPIYSEFLMDRAYYAEFHREWVVALGRGWRTAERLAAACLLAAILLAGSGWFTNIEGLIVAAAPLLLFSLLVIVSLLSRRAAWLRNCASLPWSGKVLRIEVRDGDLVQVKDFPGAPEFHRTGAVITTPKGYLVRYQGVAVTGSSAVSATSASVYIPHATIRPAMSRAEFLASLRQDGSKSP